MALKVPRGYIREDDRRVSVIGHPAPAWLVNYADLMTEMVAFFVILYALGAALDKDIVSAKRLAEELMKQKKIAGQVVISKDGMRIEMEEGGDTTMGIPFFESGKAEVTPRMVDILNQLSPGLKDLALKKHEVLVEGYTDNIPITNSQFSSNWELSTARATSVARYLIDKTAFPPGKIGAVGYGEYRPIAPNDVEENRRKNRRVVFFVKNLSNPTFKPKE